MIVVNRKGHLLVIDEIVLTTDNTAPLHLEEIPEISGICTGRNNAFYDDYIVDNYPGGDRIPNLYFLI